MLLQQLLSPNLSVDVRLDTRKVGWERGREMGVGEGWPLLALLLKSEQAAGALLAKHPNTIILPLPLPLRLAQRPPPDVPAHLMNAPGVPTTAITQSNSACAP
jgi:hypothetical protein